MIRHLLDITRDHCPMTFVKTKLRLSEIKPGDILDVLLKQGEPLENLPESVREEGHEVLKIEKVEGEVYCISIEKN